MKITFFNDHGNAGLNFWSVDQIVEAINGSCSGWSAHATTNINDPFMMASNVVVFYRTSGRSIPLMRQLNSRNIVTVYSIDDWLWHEPLKKIGLYQDIAQVTEHCDLIFCASDKLAEKVPYPNKVFTCHAMMPLQSAKILEKHKQNTTDELRVGITKGHITGDFIQFMNSCISSLAAKNLKQKIRFVLYAHSRERNLFTFSGENISVEMVNPVAGVNNFYADLASRSLDCIVNLIDKTEFNNCKCPIKFFESSAMGIPLISTSTYAYQKIMGNGLGYLCDNEDQFSERIIEIIEDRQKAKDVGAAAQEYFFKTHTNNIGVFDFMNSLGSAIEKLNSPKSIRYRALTKTFDTDLASGLPDNKDTIAQAKRFMNHIPHVPPVQVEVVTIAPIPIQDQMCLDYTTPPINDLQYFEQSEELIGKYISGLWIKGATFMHKMTSPLKVEIFNKSRLVHVGLIDHNSLLDNHWWQVFFPEFKLIGPSVKIRIYNQNKKPIALYAARNAKGKVASIGNVAVIPAGIWFIIK